MDVVKVKKYENGKPTGRGYIYKYGKLELQEGDIVKVYLGDSYVEGIVIEGPHFVDGHTLPYPASLVKTITEKIEKPNTYDQLETVTRHKSYAKKELITKKANTTQQETILNQWIKLELTRKVTFDQFEEFIKNILIYKKPFKEIPKSLFEFANAHQYTIQLIEILLERDYTISEIANAAISYCDTKDMKYMIQLGLNIREIMFLNILNNINDDKQALEMYKLFSDYGVDIDCKDKEKRTYVHTIKNPVILDQFIDSIKPNKLDENSMTALGYAMLSNDEVLVDYLINKKATLHYKSDRKYDLDVIFSYITGWNQPLKKEDYETLNEYQEVLRNLEPLIQHILRHSNIKWVTSKNDGLVEVILHLENNKEKLNTTYDLFYEKMENDELKARLYNKIFIPDDNYKKYSIENINKLLISNYIENRNYQALEYFMTLNGIVASNFLSVSTLNILFEKKSIASKFISLVEEQSQQDELFKAIKKSIYTADNPIDNFIKNIDSKQYGNLFINQKIDTEDVREVFIENIKFFKEYGFQISINSLVNTILDNYMYDERKLIMGGFVITCVNEKCIPELQNLSYENVWDRMFTEMMKNSYAVDIIPYILKQLGNEFQTFKVLDETIKFNFLTHDEIHELTLQKIDINSLSREQTLEFLYAISTSFNNILMQRWFEIDKESLIGSVYSSIMSNLIQRNNLIVIQHILKEKLFEKDTYHDLVEACVEYGQLRSHQTIDKYKQFFRTEETDDLKKPIFEVEQLFEKETLKLSSYLKEFKNLEFKRFIYDMSKLEYQKFYSAIKYLMQHYDYDLIKNNLNLYTHYRNQDNEYINLLKSGYESGDLKSTLADLLLLRNFVDTEDLYKIAYENPEFITYYSNDILEKALKLLIEGLDSESYTSVYVMKLLLESGLDVNIKIDGVPLAIYAFEYFNGYYGDIVIYDDFFADGGYGSIPSFQNVVFSYKPSLDGWVSYKKKKCPFISHIEKRMGKGFMFQGFGSSDFLGSVEYYLEPRGDSAKIMGTVTVVDISFDNEVIPVITCGITLKLEEEVTCNIDNKNQIGIVVSEQYQMDVSELDERNGIDHYILYDTEKYTKKPLVSVKEFDSRYSDKPDMVSSLDEKLINAVKKNKLSDVEKYIKDGANINVRSQYYILNVPLLEIAFQKRAKESFMFLLNHPLSNLENKNGMNETIMDSVISACNSEYLDLLLEKNISLEAISHKGNLYKDLMKQVCPELYMKHVDETPIEYDLTDLRVALDERNYKTVSYIIKNLKIESLSLFSEILSEAYFYRIDNIHNMVQNNTKAAETLRANIIIHAINENDVRLLELVGFTSEDVNKNNQYYSFDFTVSLARTFEEDSMTYFQYAILCDNPEMIDYCIKLGGDFYVRNSTKKNALYYVQSIGILQLMLDKGLNPLEKYEDLEQPISYIVNNKRSNHRNKAELRKYILGYHLYKCGYDIIPYMEQYYFDLGIRDYQKKVVKMFSIMPFIGVFYDAIWEYIEYDIQASVNIIKKLIKNGVDFTIKYKSNISLLSKLTSKKSKSDSIKESIEYINKNNKTIDFETNLKWQLVTLVKVKVSDNGNVLEYNCDKYLPELEEEVKIPYGKSNDILVGTVVSEPYQIVEYALEFDISRLKSISNKKTILDSSKRAKVL